MPIDMVIPTKFPSYLVRHPLKVTWLFHQHREVYDLYGTPTAASPTTRKSRRSDRPSCGMDNKTLRESRRVFTISKNVSGRLERFNGIGSETALSAATLRRPLPWGRVRRLRCSMRDGSTVSSAATSSSRLSATLDPGRRGSFSQAEDRSRRTSSAKWSGSVSATGSFSPDSFRRTSCSSSTPVLFRRALRAGRRGLRLCDRRGIPLRKARRYLHRFWRNPGVRRRRRDGFVVEPSPKRSATRSNRLYRGPSPSQRDGCGGATHASRTSAGIASSTPSPSRFDEGRLLESPFSLGNRDRRLQRRAPPLSGRLRARHPPLRRERATSRRTKRSPTDSRGTSRGTSRRSPTGRGSI